MKTGKTLATLAALLVAAALGWLANELLTPAVEHAGGPMAGDSPCPGGAEPLYWKAPMDPSYVREGPGKSPMGMDLVPECPSDTSAAEDGAVVVDAATVQKIGVRTARAERRDLSRSIRAMSRVAYDERLVSHVHTKVQGWVERLLVDYVGHEVKRGQPLLEIYSPELVATQEELLMAARYRESTRASPFDEVRGGGESLYAATLRRLELWDVPERDVQRMLETGEVKRTLTLYAPVSGVVTRLGVRAGMEVRPNENLYTIADLSSVWVLADVYEYELPWVELGQRGVVELASLPGREIEGQVTYISPFLDPKTRTAEIRIELPNRDRALKPEMFGHAILSGVRQRDAVAVPQESVLRSGRRSVVIVALGAGRFEPREVALGVESGDGWVEVLEGLDAGEEIVVSSQFLIDSESNLREAIRKLRTETAPSPGDGPPDRSSSSPNAPTHAAGDAHEDHPGHTGLEDHAGHAGHTGHEE